jgi:hypothetical protein
MFYLLSGGATTRLVVLSNVMRERHPRAPGTVTVTVDWLAV